jgi:CubicO group peptidase (beta-lactamase class C family)
MNPLQKYLKSFFAKKRVLGDDSKLLGLLSADVLLSDLVYKKKVPGLSITVLKKGEILLQKGYGYADLEYKLLVDPKKTLFRIASISKPIAATALAQLVIEGQIDLDASFYRYVPYYPKKKWDFTIRQLAGHTAGIRGYQGMEYALNRPYTIKESIEIFKDDDLLFEPGTGYQYTSYDWVLLSLAMQEVCGVPFEEYVRKTVLEPLGLTNTFASEENIQGENIAKFYSKNRKGFRNAIPVDNQYKLAGGGYLSTSDDIANFGRAYLDRKVLNDELGAQFLTSQTIIGNPTYYGLGWQVSNDSKGRPFYGHIGNAVGAYSNLFIYPEEEMVFSILVNCTDPKVQNELDEVVDRLLQRNMS